MAAAGRSDAEFTLAHLSDVHLSPLPPIGARHWNVKRLLGWLNWQHRRRHFYSRDVLDRIVADIVAQAPDHIAVTGDLANLGLPAEHEAALAWLRALGDPERVTVIPGNHDIYSRIGTDVGTARWHPHMSPNTAAADYAIAEALSEAAAFPFVRRFGKLAIIALNSAVPTWPFYAIGRIGKAQLERLGRILDRLGAEGLTRVVLIHHPPLPGLAKARHDLEDADALADVLARHGAELVLHGHEHIASEHWHPSSSGAIPVIGVPSASLARPYKKEPPARYHLYRLALNDNRPSIELISRGLAEPDGPVVELERRRIAESESQ
ncbi:MAG TPA: metallophosphoesterase [Hyphomicrobiaceae bacterium]|nr:metallophosphoesterase [Hyphomicrobiaceae bacterium]